MGLAVASQQVVSVFVINLAALWPCALTIPFYYPANLMILHDNR